MIIDMNQQIPIEFGLTGVKQVVQNVRTILTTIQGTVPLERGFGIDITSLDQPTNLAQALMSTEIVAALLAFEPRVSVTQVDFTEEPETGRLVPIVHIEFVDESEVVI